MLPGLYGKEFVGAELDGQRHRYPPGQRLLVLHDGQLFEATVTAGPGRVRPTRHALHIPATDELGTFDLNGFNHCRRRFETVTEFAESRLSYRAHMRTQIALGGSFSNGSFNKRLATTRGLEDSLSRLASEARKVYPEGDVELLMHEAWGAGCCC